MLPCTTDGKKQREIKQIEDIFVLTPTIRKLLEIIETCRRRSKLSKEPYCALITGPQGVGKTTTFDYYEQQSPRAETDSGIRVPVLSVQIPVPATVKSLVTEMLTALGDPAASKGTVVTQTARLQKMLNECAVDLIILDEFQHFIERDSDIVLRTVSDWLKRLINLTRVSVVLGGMPYSSEVLDAAGNEQLRDRFSERMSIGPYSWGRTALDRRDFRAFLSAVEKGIPLKSNLSSLEMSYRLFCASNGFPRHVMNLVRTAAVKAIERDQRELTLDLLEETYNERYSEQYPYRKNPFCTEIDDLEVKPFPNAQRSPKKKKHVTTNSASGVVKVS